MGRFVRGFGSAWNNAGVVGVASVTHNWHAFGHFFATVTAPALIGVLAAIAVSMALGGFTTLAPGHDLATGPGYPPEAAAELRPLSSADRKRYRPGHDRCDRYDLARRNCAG